MYKCIKVFLLVFISISMFTACNSDRDVGVDDEDRTRGMEEFWKEEREKFIVGAENQIEEHEETLQEMEETERVNELNAELENVRERLSELEQDEEHEWENTRDEIAHKLIEIRREIEDIE